MHKCKFCPFNFGARLPLLHHLKMIHRDQYDYEKEFNRIKDEEVRANKGHEEAIVFPTLFDTEAKSIPKDKTETIGGDDEW